MKTASSLLIVLTCSVCILSSPAFGQRPAPAQPPPPPPATEPQPPAAPSTPVPAATPEAPPAPSTKEKLREIKDLSKRDSQAIPALAKFLDDPSTEVRSDAVKAIVNIGTQYSLEPLIRATRDRDPEIQARATDGLVDFYLPGYVAKGMTSTLTRTGRFVEGAFSSRNDQIIEPNIVIREDVAKALGPMIANSASVKSKANAALAAGILRDKLAVPELIGALRSGNTNLVYQSVIAIQKIGDRSAGPAVTLLAQDADEKVQLVALETIGVLDYQEAEPTLRQVLDRARSTKVRRAALEALSLLALPTDRPVFIQYASDKDSLLRASALEGLGRLREPEDIPLLEGAFSESGVGEQVRLAAAFGLVSEGKVETTEFSALRYLVNGLNLKAQSSAAQAYLTELLLQPAVRQAVLPLVPTGTREEKILFGQALAKSGGADAVPTLEALTKDPDSDVAASATKSLRILQARLPVAN
jgi:HEAT repeat protein